MIKLEIKKLQYDNNRGPEKIFSLSSGKINKYQYLTGEEIFPSNKKQIKEQAKFTYSPLGKTFEKQTKPIEDQGEKDVDALKNLKLKDQRKSIEGIFPKDHESDEIKNNLHQIKRYKNRVIRDTLFYESSKQVYDFKVFKIIRSFGDSIYNHKIEIRKANQEQADLLEYILSFNNKTKPRSNEDKNLKNDVFHSARILYESRELVLKAFKNELLPLKSTKGTGLKKLTPKQMLKRLPITLAQVKVGNNSENLLNEIRQIVYSFCQSNEITKKYTIT